jgi:NAD(P)-dependent dehydrogenase (short-subunit alcohol dehydrogenase family)
MLGGIVDIANKVALVTGAGSGIGRASAIRLAREGASVVVADIDEPGGRETVAQIAANGGKAAFVRADVTLEADVRAMIAFAESTFGGLDILHNNAGLITGPPRWPDTEPERWVRMLEINLRGVILGTQLAIPALRKRGGGAVVNTASMAGIGAGFPPNPVYAASKGGVVLFTASLAPLKDEANIRVNCVCPGVVDTPMLRRAAEGVTPQESQATEARLRGLKILQPEEIADAMVELIRDDALAGRAMMIRKGVPRELLRLPEIPHLV